MCKKLHKSAAKKPAHSLGSKLRSSSGPKLREIDSKGG